jgi:hypothetical protein
MKKLPLLLLVLLPSFVLAQADHSHKWDRAITFPNLPTFKTLACDLHIHTVFSDGYVWPDIRVKEALLDGLDAISLTEHLEYQPHKKDIPNPDRNRSYELAVNEANDHNLLIIRGSEITRSMPPGHCNAIFIQDANKLLISDSIEIFKEAKRQGAFIFWNHPNWVSQRKDGMATLTDMHKRLIKDGLLNGIEVANDVTVSEEALKIALDNNLTLMGTSDIHELIDWQFDVAKGGHRPITLVFAKEKSIEGIKQGLLAGQTVVFYKNSLVGKSEFLTPLIQESLKFQEATYDGNSTVLNIPIENTTNAAFTLQNNSAFTFHNSLDIVSIKPFEKITLSVKTVTKLSDLKLAFTVLNAAYAPGKHPVVTYSVKVN